MGVHSISDRCVGPRAGVTYFFLSGGLRLRHWAACVSPARSFVHGGDKTAGSLGMGLWFSHLYPQYIIGDPSSLSYTLQEAGSQRRR